ncbi:hypothetical protein [Methanoregula sp.]|jgi:hypothetical protein|uniref:hypothetical protein n=1 Tax=Methanoregula sp. TaxID=2052170 RepID=UPI003C25558B
MPKISGKSKERVSFSCDPAPFKKMHDSVKAGEASSISALINTAITFYFDNRDKTPKDQVVEWLKSDDGEQYIETILKRIAAKKK